MLSTSRARLGAAALAVVVVAVGAPAALADTATKVVTNTVDAAGTKARTHPFDVTATGTITVSVDWTTTTANLDVFLSRRNADGTTFTEVARATSTTARPETITYDATATGRYQVRVLAKTGASAYTATITYPVAPTGAGNGKATFYRSYGFSGSAGLYAYGMDFDPTDKTILVADYWNYRVWRYTKGGTRIGLVSQHALGGMEGGITAPYDVEADPTDQVGGGASVWVADQGSSRFVQFSHTGAWLQTIGKTSAGQRTGVDATHPGHAYAFGCGGGQMQIPTHILADTVFPNRLLYVSDPACRNVWIFDHSGGYMGALDWTGSGLGNPIPRGVAEDAAGNIYVAEFNSRKIFVFNPSTRRIIGVIPAQSDMNDVRGLDIDTTRHMIYTVGAYWNRVYQFSYDPAKVAAGGGPSSVVGRFVNEWRNIDGTNYATGHQSFDSIRFPAVDDEGNVYVGETWGCDAWCNGTPYGYGVEKFAPGDVVAKPSCTVTNAGTAQTTCAGATRLAWATGPQPPPRGGFNQQNGIAINPADNSLFVVDTFEQRVQKFDTGSTCAGEGSCPAWIRQWGSRQPASPASDGFGYPRALTFGDDGRVWVGDNNNAVLAFTPDGTFVHRFGSQGKTAGQFSGGVQGIRVRGGRVYATDVGGCRLQVFDEAKLLSAPNIASAPAGTLLENLGTCGTGANQMTAPRGIAVDPANPDLVYVAETGTNRISRWNLATAAATQFKPSCGGKGLAQPWGITERGGWYYIGDVKNARVVRWNPGTGACEIVVTQADLPAGLQFLGANFVEFDSAGRMYVSDNSRHIYAFTLG